MTDLNTFRITSLGEKSYNAIDDGHGEIIAVFRHSLYLQSHKHTSQKPALFCIGVRHLPKGPLNVVTTLDSFTELKAGQQWHHQNNLLTLNECIALSTNNPPLWKQPCPCNQRPDQKQRIHTCEFIAGSMQETHNTAQSPVATAINRQLHLGELKLIEWLGDKSCSKPGFMCDLLGCGDGLTPAGDDFLLGAVMALHFLTIEPHASLLAESIVNKAPGRTNAISLAHLHAACEGQANELLMNFFSACIGSDEPELKACIEQLSNFGHSSGRYTLSGVKTVFENC